MPDYAFWYLPMLHKPKFWHTYGDFMVIVEP